MAKGADDSTETTGTETTEVTTEDIGLLDLDNVEDETDDTVEEEDDTTDTTDDVSDKKKVADKAETTTDDTKWFDGIDNEDLKAVAKSFESRDELLKALGSESSDDWRASIKDPKLREYANRYSSITDVVKSSLDLRQQVSNSLVPPGKGASKKDREAFSARLNKLLDVPADPSGYAFPKKQDGSELTETEKTSQENWAKLFHENNIPKSAVDSILQRLHDEVLEGRAAISAADDRFAEESELEMRGEWGDDFDANRTLAYRTARELFGEDFDDMMKATSNNRLLMDTPMMLRMLARIGREMNEGSVDLLTQSERETIDDQIKDVRQRAEDAKSQGDTRLANKLFADEQALLGKIVGNRPIVGAGRTV